MKKFIKTLFTALLLFVVYISVAQTNTIDNTHHQVAIESVTEFESSSSEFTNDALLLNDNMVCIPIFYKLASSEKKYILLNLGKDIFRPPLIS
jgi:hypothetical protein